MNLVCFEFREDLDEMIQGTFIRENFFIDGDLNGYVGSVLNSIIILYILVDIMFLDHIRYDIAPSIAFIVCGHKSTL